MFTKLMADIMSKNTDKALFVEGDYYKKYFDDMEESKVIICGVCGKPKECYPYVLNGDERVYPFGYPKKIKCLCDCEVDERRKNLKTEQLRKKALELKLNCWGYIDEYNQQQRNKSMEQITFKDYTENKHIKACRRYLDTLSEQITNGKGLVLCGKSGAGKTIATMCLANALMDRGLQVIYKQCFQITTLSQYEDKQELSAIENCKVLFIDDINFDNLNDCGRELLFNILELRIKRNLPTIITSNITKANIESPINQKDKRILDRFADINNYYIIEDSTHNYRKE